MFKRTYLSSKFEKKHPLQFFAKFECPATIATLGTKYKGQTGLKKYLLLITKHFCIVFRF